MVIAAATPTFAASIVPGCGADLATPPPTPYVALRHLEARTERGGRSGWIDVRTTLTGDGRFVYEVLQEGSSTGREGVDPRSRARRRNSSPAVRSICRRSSPATRAATLSLKRAA